MEGGENHEPPRFCIEVNVSRGGRKLAVLWLHHGDAEDTVDIHCKTVCLNELFSDVNIFSIVLSKKDNFLNVSPKNNILKFTEEGSLRTLHCFPQRVPHEAQ